MKVRGTLSCVSCCVVPLADLTKSSSQRRLFGAIGAKSVLHHMYAKRHLPFCWQEPKVFR